MSGVLHRIDDLEKHAQNHLRTMGVLHRIDDLENAHRLVKGPFHVRHRLDDLEILLFLKLL